MNRRLRIAVIFLFIESMFMNLGFFMLIPMLSIHYLALGISAIFVGDLYAVRILAQQGLQLFGGYVGDRLPYRVTILIGCVIRSLGFALFAIIPSGGLLYGAATLFGIGGALFGPAQNAALAALVPRDQQARAFALRQAAANVGTTVGPVLGAFLVYGHFDAICLISGALFLGLGGVGMILLPPGSGFSTGKQSLWQGVQAIARNRAFVLFVLLFMGYYFVYQQMYIALPAFLTTIHAPSDALGLMFSLEAVLEIAASYPFIAWQARRGGGPPRLMGIGLFILGIGWIPLAFSVNIGTLIFMVATLSLGSVVALPGRQTYTSSLADQPYLATYFGVSSMSMAIGASVGASGGGILMHAGRLPVGPLASWPALVFGGVALICAWFLQRLPDASRAAPIGPGESAE
jgi:DHA1 family multidrug resistance protein-like MFS transporter